MGNILNLYSSSQLKKVISAVLWLCSCYQLLRVIWKQSAAGRQLLEDEDRIRISSLPDEVEEDRISSLPDDVILVILSFLTLKEMVKTSILSSQWLNLWVNTPVLDLRPPDLLGNRIDTQKRHNDFVEWVNHVLRLQRHKGHCLKEFRIGYNLDDGHRKDIDRWLEFALEREVEILELDFSIRGRVSFESFNNYELPDCFLEFRGRKANLDGLKCLKSLLLKNVGVSGEAVNLILLNCLFLERFEVVGSHKLVDLVISDPTLKLKYLRVDSCFRLKVLAISNFNLVSLYTTVGHLNLVDLPMLVELSIAGVDSYNISQTLSQVASGLSQLEALSLDARELKELTQQSILAQLTNLKRLVISVGAGHDQSLTMIVPLMKSCLRLEEFVLELIDCIAEWTSRTMCEVERLSSKSKSLKVFEFRGYHGRVSDVELTKHVVENAPWLEKIIIKPCNFRLRKYLIHSIGQEARRMALKQFEHLKESNYIPPHIDVLIR